jgi:glycosyltransferase involved in cell wall biosynthesis
VEEILVIDDSADQDLVSHEPTVRMLKTGGGKGASFARNLGLRESTGNWVAFLDDDDIWLPKKLELQMAFMKSEKLNVSFTNCIELPNGNVRPNPSYNKIISPLFQLYDKGIRLRSRYYLGFSSIVIDHNFKNSVEFNTSWKH